MKKLMLGVSGAAVALLFIGGGTFALWSDTDSYGNSAGAEHLTLDVDSTSTQGFSQTAMAPGVNREFDFVVASRDGDEVPDASLTLTLENLLGTEDGCRGNSEEAPVVDGGDGGACLSPGTGPAFGEYADEVRIIVNTSQPTTDVANACSQPRGSKVSSMSLRDLETLGTVSLLDSGVTLGPGEGICVAMGLTLPTGATNASQGDSASWDFRYDLNQVVVP